MVSCNLDDVVDRIPGLDMSSYWGHGYWYLGLEFVSSLLVGADGYFEHGYNHGLIF